MNYEFIFSGWKRWVTSVLAGFAMANYVIAQDAINEPVDVLDETALRNIISSIAEPSPKIKKKRESYYSISSVRRFYHKNPRNHMEEQTKRTFWHPHDNQTYIYIENIFPSIFYTTLATPANTWFISRSGKWAVENNSNYAQGETNKELDELLSYVVDVKLHPYSQYKLVSETETTWTIDEIPSEEFINRLAKNILTHGGQIDLASELINNPRLALLRLTIDKQWRLVTLKEIYGESGVLWYQTTLTNLMEVPLDANLFKLPSGCIELGNGEEKLKKMFTLEKAEQNKKQ